MLYARTFQKLPEGSGSFRNILSGAPGSCIALYGFVLSCIIFIAFPNITFPQRRFRNLPEGSGRFRNILSGAPGSFIALYGLSCIIFIAFRNITFPQRRFRKVPEPSGRFWNVHCPHIPFHVILLHFNVSPKNAHTAHFPHEHAF